MEPLAGFEPATYSLRVNCSTPELQRPWTLGRCSGRHLFSTENPCDKPKYEVVGTARQMGNAFLAWCSVSISLHPLYLEQSRKRRYLLGISGGRDSVALLHLLLDAGYNNLVLCHLNHALRGKASAQDAAFVRRLAKKHGLVCETARKDIPALMVENGESMELAARNARRRFFSDCARKYRCNRILLAHHADDQAETILFNLLRGSYGLKGMVFMATHDVHGKELCMLRPLLDVTRDQINDYLAARKINFREDATNAEGVTTRNRLRNEVMPLLTEIMGREIRPPLVRAEAASRAQQKAISDTLESLKLHDPQGRLFLPKLARLSPALRSAAIHAHLKRHDIADINHDLLERCCGLITDKTVAEINLPGGKFLRRKEKRLFIS